MEHSQEINLTEILSALLRKIWLIVLCALLVGAAAYGYTVNFIDEEYEAKVSLYVHSSSIGTGVNGSVSSNDLLTAQRLVNTYVNILASDTVLDKVASTVGHGMNAEKIRGMMSAEAVANTEAFSVCITYTDPELATDIANTIANIAPSEIAAIVEGGVTRVIDYAKLPKTPVSPNKKQNTIYGLVIGAVIAVAIIAIQVLTDVHIKNEDDLTRIADIPILGLIPDLAGGSKPDKGYRYESYNEQAQSKLSGKGGTNR